MRKTKLVIVSLGILCLLTGCGEKKLECSLKETNQDSEIVFVFNSKDKIKSGTMDISFKFSGDLEEDAIKKGLDLLKETYKEMGFDPDITQNNKLATISLKFKKDQLDKLFGSNVKEDDGYEDLKAKLEKEGATCK